MPFAPGLNVLTGETGAGKSIVVDALLLITGARAQPDWIRTGADTALVEAVFEIDPAGPVAALLDEAGLMPGDGQLVVKRELARSGRHRAFVNDGAATWACSSAWVSCWWSCTASTSTSACMEPARQLQLLDRFAEALDRAGARGRAGAHVGRGARRARSPAGRDAGRSPAGGSLPLPARRDRRRPAPRTARRTSCGPSASRLQHAERIVAGLAGDGRPALRGARSRPPTRLEPRGRARCGTSRATSRTRPPPSRPSRARRPSGGRGGPGARACATARCSTPSGSSRSTRGSTPSSSSSASTGTPWRRSSPTAQEVATALDRITRHDAIAEEMERAVAEAAAAAGGGGAPRSPRPRTRGAERLERLIQKEIRGLGMEHGRVPGGPAPRAGGGRRARARPDGWRLGRGRRERRAAALGQPRRGPPAARQGRLGRRALAHDAGAQDRSSPRADAVPVLVFDEVDAGIGGRVADVVGQKLRPGRGGPPGPLRDAPGPDRRLRRPAPARGEARGPRRDARPRSTAARCRRRPGRGGGPHAGRRARHRRGLPHARELCAGDVARRPGSRGPGLLVR